MGKIGVGKVNLSTVAPAEWAETLDKRAQPLGWSRAQMLAAIVELWMRQGCPPVSEPDRLMQLAQTASRQLTTAPQTSTLRAPSRPASTPAPGLKRA